MCIIVNNPIVRLPIAGSFGFETAGKRGILPTEGRKHNVIWLKSTLVGLLALFASAILIVIVGVVYLSIASRSSETGVVGWDPISLARPLTWLAVVLGIFLA